MTVIFWLAICVLLLFGVVVFRGAPYVPSKKRDLKVALEELYKLGKEDVLVDIGSGDGVVLRAAAERGARAVGFEINPVLVLISRLISRSSLITVRLADFWLVKLPDETTVVYTFGSSNHIVKMANYVENEANRLNKTLYLMSYGFDVPGYEAYRQKGTHFLYKFGGTLQNKVT